jgi:hypothetical protein
MNNSPNRPAGVDLGSLDGELPEVVFFWRQITPSDEMLRECGSCSRLGSALQFET